MKRLISTSLFMILALSPLAWSHDEHDHHYDRHDRYSDDYRNDHRYDKRDKYRHHKKHRRHHQKYKQHYRQHRYDAHRYWNGYRHNQWSARYYTIKPHGFGSYHYRYNKRHGHYHGLTLCYSSH